MNRRWLWLSGGLLLVTAGCAGGLALLPLLLKDDVQDAVDAQLDVSIEADVQLGGVQLGLLSSFPQLDLHLTDLHVVGQGDFAGVTLATMPEIHIGIDLFSLFFGDTVTLRSVALVDPVFDLRILADGRSNVSALATGAAPADPDAPEVGLRLDRVTVDNATLTFDDRSTGARTEILGLDVRASGDLTARTTHLQTHTTIESLTASQGGVAWLRDTVWDADIALDQDVATGGLTLRDNRIAVNALTVRLDGSVVPEESGWDVDLALSTEETAFAPLLSLLPGAYTESFDGVDADGTVSLSGKVLGLAGGDDWPALDLALVVADGRYRFADQPLGVEAIAVDVTLHHPGGDPDLLEIDLDNLAMTVGETPITGRMTVRRPMTDPVLDLAAQGRLDLDALGRSVPAVADAQPPSGVLDLDVTARGRMSAFQEGQSESIEAAGQVLATGLRYAPPDWPVITIERLDLTLSPQSARLDTLDLTWTGSHASLQGEFDNLLPYLLADETLVGRLALTSDQTVDVRPFQGEDAAAGDPGEEAVVVPVPGRLDLQIGVTLARALTTELDLSNVTGSMHVVDHTVHMKGWRADTLGGTIDVSGSYRAQTDEHADIDLSMDALQFDLGETFAQFETLRHIAPLLEGATGRVDSDGVAKARIKRDGSPELALMSSSGTIGAGGVRLRAASLADMAAKLGAPNLPTIRPGRIAYTIREGSLHLKPFRATFGSVPATVSGKTGILDGALDLVIDLTLPKAGGVQLLVGGTLDKPKIRLASELVDAVKETVKAEVAQVTEEARAGVSDAVREQADALVDAAQEQADRLRSEAAKAAKAIRTEGRTQADKLEAAAAGNPLSELAATEAAKRVKAEARKAAARVEQEADKTASKVVAEANAKREALLESTTGG